MILDKEIKVIIEDKNVSDYSKGEMIWNNKNRICQQNNLQGEVRATLGSLVGVGDSTMGRIKYIMQYGTEEQKRRARKGGREADGRNNQIWAIATEIRDNNYMLPNKPKPKTAIKIEPRVEPETIVCKVCGQEKPASSFTKNNKGYHIFTCNSCRWQHDKRVKAEKELQKSLEKPVSMTEESLNDYLYNQENEFEYTIDDLTEEILINGKNGIKSVETSLEIHKDLLSTEENREKTMAVLKTLSHRFYELQLMLKEN